MGQRRFEGKCAIVAGGARGIGAAIAESMAAEGAKVIIADILRDEGEATACQIRNLGGKALFVATDVSNEGQVRAMVSVAVRQYGGVDVLINNAGIKHPQDVGVLDLSWEVWQGVLAVNLGAPFLCSKHVLRRMLEQGRGGSITIISSIGALMGGSQPYAQDAYAMAKAGILALTKSIALQYGRQRIRCNAILTGPIMTDLNVHLFATEEQRKAYLALLALTAPGQPRDVAQSALFLSDEQASPFITGHTLIADGGATLLLS